MKSRFALLACILTAFNVTYSQTSPREPITNSDIISMAQAGIGEHTIIIAIERGPVRLDTSAQALIALKKAGLSDQVLNAVLSAGKSSVGTPAKFPARAEPDGARNSEHAHPLHAQVLFEKALDAIGPKEKLTNIQSVKSRYTYTFKNPDGTLKSYEVEDTRVYPDKSATVFTPSSGPSITQVLTQEFGYTSAGGIKAPLSDADLAKNQESFKLDPFYIARHTQDYEVEFAGTENREGAVIDLLRINTTTTTRTWGLDDKTGRLAFSCGMECSEPNLTIYSDYRVVDGIAMPFHISTRGNGNATEFTYQDVAFNPSIDAALFTPPVPTPDRLLQKALDATASGGSIFSIKAIRIETNVTQTSDGTSSSFERELTKVFPDSIATVDDRTGSKQTEVVGHDFGYRNRLGNTTAIPWADIVTTQQLMKFDPIYVGQHRQDFSPAFACEEQATSACDVLRLTEITSNTSALWVLDPRSKRVLSIRTMKPLPEQQIEFSDYQLVNKIDLPFHIVTTLKNQRTEETVQKCEINPYVDPVLFQKPESSRPKPVAEIPTPVVSAPAESGGLTLRVLQSESVPYVQESGGGIATNCSIVGTANTSAYATSYGNTAYGNATTNSTQRMSCNSYDTTMRWPHVLNVMFAQASDGNSYIIACDRAWRWSKCVPLRAGDTFNARFTSKGLEVEAVNSKGKEEDPVYHVLQSAVSR